MKGWAFIAAAAVSSWACGREREVRQPAQPAAGVERVVTAVERAGLEHGVSDAIGPLPPAPVQGPNVAALGRDLFFSKVVSGDGRVACSSCHLPEHGFAAPDALSSVDGRPESGVNTPSLLNVAYLTAFNWNGRFTRLDEHLDSLIQNPSVQATTWSSLAERLAASPEWKGRFSSAFATGVSPDNARAALLAYERTLIAADSPFDRWLAGDREAISSDARQGYALFESHGCVSCHQGVLVGGNMFQRLGIMKPYFTEPSAVRDADLGRFALTGRERDRYVFRVPSLRNVALSAPYLHDGSQPTLATVVSVMASYQLGRDLEPDQIDQIVAFLETLTGRQPEAAP
ncbi:MAG TPA: cytochrome c peroxidase [Polyangiaceae bacterium]|nr:cytochrome c peroxidase [Polyangiaceae bacterium]